MNSLIFARLCQAMILIMATVFIHSVGTVGFLKMLYRYRPYWEKHGGVVVNTLSLTWVVGTLVMLHLLEIAVWALFYWIGQIFPTFETSVYFSLVTYTTVGFGDVVPPPTWRAFASFEALVGILMCAWSTALLLAVVNGVHSKTLASWREREAERHGRL